MIWQIQLSRWDSEPIVLRKTVQGYYIVVGERRFRASKIAGLKYVSAIIKDLTDEDMMELAVIENLQREDLNAIEESWKLSTFDDRFENYTTRSSEAIE